MAATASPSHSQQQEHVAVDDLQNHDPNPTEPPPPEPPHFETLETPDLPNPLQFPRHDQPLHNPQQSDKDEDTVLLLDEEDQQSQQKNDHQSGTHTLPEPIVLADDTMPPPPPLTSPVHPHRRHNKRKKGAIHNALKRKYSMKKAQNLTDILNPIPFTPSKSLDFDKHEEVLKRLGLWEFSKIEFDRSFRTDLVIQLIVNYDPKKRCSYVNDLRIPVNRADLARALRLPLTKQEKGSSSNVEEVDLDSEMFSDESIKFIDDFVSNFVLLHEDSWIIPTEIVNWTRCIKDGHPEKMDSASLIWYMVEKELNQGDKLVDCYYASHLQYLIRSQREELFMVEMEVEEVKEEDDGVAEDGDETVKPEEEKEEKEEEKEEKEEEKEEKEEKEDGEEKEDEEEEKEEEKEEKEEERVSLVQEHNIELNLGPDLEEEGKNDDEVMVDAEECKEEEQNCLLDGNNVLGNHFLQRCHSFEERKPEEVEDEQIEEEEDEEEEERVEDGFDMEGNDDSLDRDGLTDNFLQGVETSDIPFGSQSELRGMSSMDLFGGPVPSFFNNGGKRVMEHEEDMHHLDVNNKRLKTDEMWEQKPHDFGFCMDQMHQLIEKAKMIHESKEQSYANSQFNNQLTMNHFQERQNVLEVVIKSKDEELEKKRSEVFRLERELYLMSDLLAGYRKALNDTRFKFSEYRKRYVLREEPVYKDAGPGGLVLSARELEKQRLKQEEDKMKFVLVAKNLEGEFVCKFEMHQRRVLIMAEKLVFIENEVKRVREELFAKRKEIQKPLDEHKQEENQKPLDEHEQDEHEQEENHKPLDEHEQEENHKPLDEHEQEENQKSLDEHEQEENQKPLNEHEHEENQKPLNEHEQEENQQPHDEVPENNDTSLQNVLLDAAESKEPEGVED